MANASESNQSVATLLAKAYGGSPKACRFWDDDQKSSIDILSCLDQPQKGVTSFGTIGLSDHPLQRKETEPPLRVELVGACGANFPKFDNALASAAFCVINNNWFCFPGAVFPNVLAAHGYSETLPHFFFTSPFLWENKLHTLSLQDKKVAWLLAIPISEKERDFAATHGSENLEALFEENQIDVFDLVRASVV